MTYTNAHSDLTPISHLRTYQEEAEMVRLAVDCVLNGEKAVYASSELTTGPRLFQLFRENGVKDIPSLKRALGETEWLRRVWNPNVAEANAFARELRDRLPGRPLTVTPAPFLAPHWKQDEYLALWESLVRTRFKAVFFSDDWEYSNGCTFEFAVAWDAGLPTCDARGNPLGLSEGMQKIARAAGELEAEGFDAHGLRENLRRLEAIRRDRN